MGVHLKFLQSPAIEAATLQSMYTTCIHMYTMYTFEICIEIHRTYLHNFTYMIIHAYVYPQSPACIITFARAQNFPTRMNNWGKNCTWLLLSVPDRGLHKMGKDMWHFNYCKFCKLSTWSFQSEEFSSLFALLHYLHYSHFLRQNSTILRKIELSIFLFHPQVLAVFPQVRCSQHCVTLLHNVRDHIELDLVQYIPKLQ